MLSQVQSQLVAWAFYAYFVGSIIFFLSLKVDVLQKFGYKRHYLLVYYFLHLVLFLQHNGVFLPYRFIYSRTWFSIQQIVANPLAIKMGSPDTGAHRLTLAGINSFGTTIGAILLGIALFGMGNDKTDLSLEDIKLPL
jgi:FHS family L-fucose permease-like MFS transporter